MELENRCREYRQLGLVDLYYIVRIVLLQWLLILLLLSKVINLQNKTSNVTIKTYFVGKPIHMFSSHGVSGEEQRKV